MTLEFEDWGLDVKISGTWIPLKADVLQQPGPRWGRGVLDNGPLDRVGDSTTLTFSLKNHEGNSAGVSGYYSPGHASALSGWTTGLPVRLWFKFESRTFYKFYGLIEPNGITPDAGLHTQRSVRVSAQNFMSQASSAELNLLAQALNKTIDEAMDLLMANMIIQPLATDYAAGVDTFPTVFDASGAGASAISEMLKLAVSEFGMIYDKGDESGGETLVVENRNSRSNVENTRLPKVNADSGLLLLDDIAWTGSTWSIVAGKAVNTPTLGSELLANGVFASDTVWTKGAGWTIAAGVATHAAGSAGNLTQSVLTVGRWYHTTFDATISAGQLNLYLGAGSIAAFSTSGSKLTTGRSTGGGALFQFSAGASLAGTVDNATCKQLTLSSLFATIPTGYNQVRVSAALTVVTGTPAGVIVCLDSAASPANFLIAYHDGTNVILDKCVGGTYTNLISAAATYVASAVLLITTQISGSNLLVNVTYNGSAVGTQQTVSDAGIKSNTIHGMFSTYSGNTLDNFQILLFSDSSEIFSDTFTRSSLNPTDYGVGYLLLEDGGDLVLTEDQEAVFDNVFYPSAMQHSWGKNLANRIRGITPIRKVDDAATTELYVLPSPIQMTAGQSITVRGSYRDPAGGASYVNCDPTSMSDSYTANSSQDGSGTNLTSSLSVTPSYGSSEVEFILTASAALWVTSLKAIGKGIYLYDPLSLIFEDTDEQAAGVFQLTFDTAYQSDPTKTQAFAEYTLNLEKQPNLTVERAPMLANRDSLTMYGFLLMEPGTRGHFVEDQIGLDADCFVNGYEAEMFAGRYVIFSPCLKNASSNYFWVWDTSAWDTDAIWAFPE